jgi:hypothetical protein
MKTAAWIIFILLGCTGDFAFSAQSATVITDGAMVYKKGDFDSAVVGYMKAGQKIRISSKKFGPFYRIQFKQGVIAYISDVDIHGDESDDEMPTSKKSKSNKPSESESRAKSFISKTYLGLSYGMLNYSEVFNQRNESESLTFYGVKFTMPMRYLSGPFVLDTNLLYHSGYPSYYNMSTPPSQGISGKILTYDALVMYSLAEGPRRNFWAYAGGGLALSYNSFVVEVSGSKKDLSDVLFGGVIGGGIAFQTGKIAYKIEPKYYVMKSNYLAIIGSVQYEF